MLLNNDPAVVFYIRQMANTEIWPRTLQFRFASNAGQTLCLTPLPTHPWNQIRRKEPLLRQNVVMYFSGHSNLPLKVLGWLRSRWPKSFSTEIPDLRQVLPLCISPSSLTHLVLDLGATAVGGKYEQWELPSNRAARSARTVQLEALTALASLPELQDLWLLCSHRFRMESANNIDTMTCAIASALCRVNMVVAWVSRFVLAFCLENVHPARSCPLGFEFEKQGSRTAWLITGQQFQGVGTNLTAFILTFQNVSPHLCQQIMRVAES